MSKVKKMSASSVEKYPQASPAGGVIFYDYLNWLDGERVVYLSERIIDGKPTGLYSIYGGFAECGDFLKHPIGHVQNKLVEVYRECKEEIGEEFTKIVPLDDFLKNSEYVCNLLIRTNDVNKIHDSLFVSYAVTDRLANFLANNAKPTEEQMPAKPYSITLKDGGIVLPEGIKLFHAHEADAIAAFLNQKH
jgi:hypothetical protein